MYSHIFKPKRRKLYTPLSPSEEIPSQENSFKNQDSKEDKNNPMQNISQNSRILGEKKDDQFIDSEELEKNEKTQVSILEIDSESSVKEDEEEMKLKEKLKVIEEHKIDEENAMKIWSGSKVLFSMQPNSSVCDLHSAKIRFNSVVKANENVPLVRSENIFVNNTTKANFECEVKHKSQEDFQDESTKFVEKEKKSEKKVLNRELLISSVNLNTKTLLDEIFERHVNSVTSYQVVTNHNDEDFISQQMSQQTVADVPQLKHLTPNEENKNREFSLEEIFRPLSDEDIYEDDENSRKFHQKYHDIKVSSLSGSSKKIQKQQDVGLPEYNKILSQILLSKQSFQEPTTKKDYSSIFQKLFDKENIPLDSVMEAQQRKNISLRNELKVSAEQPSSISKATFSTLALNGLDTMNNKFKNDLENKKEKPCRTSKLLQKSMYEYAVAGTSKSKLQVKSNAKNKLRNTNLDESFKDEVRKTPFETLQNNTRVTSYLVDFCRSKFAD
ncbi:CLUMA_CG011721, isoform A [Clunio marinus]|uniref:CLUMA_CG011721, isoform A n=1 Tax=Clunio marinus TaxID=568069 RepID=A0A1J1IIT0_9DIPT|nr:CLUMA_CG011721, isoform A [Clunio marinus]